jgi:hypothetical protein
MTKSYSQKSFTLYYNFFTFCIKRLNNDMRRAVYLTPNAGDTKAAFWHALLP